MATLSFDHRVVVVQECPRTGRGEGKLVAMAMTVGGNKWRLPLARPLTATSLEASLTRTLDRLEDREIVFVRPSKDMMLAIADWRENGGAVGGAVGGGVGGIFVTDKSPVWSTTTFWGSKASDSPNEQGSGSGINSFNPKNNQPVPLTKGSDLNSKSDGSSPFLMGYSGSKRKAKKITNVVAYKKSKSNADPKSKLTNEPVPKAKPSMKSTTSHSNPFSLGSVDSFSSVAKQQRRLDSIASKSIVKGTSTTMGKKRKRRKRKVNLALEQEREKWEKVVAEWAGKCEKEEEVIVEWEGVRKERSMKNEWVEARDEEEVMVEWEGVRKERSMKNEWEGAIDEEEMMVEWEGVRKDRNLVNGWVEARDEEEVMVEWVGVRKERQLVMECEGVRENKKKKKWEGVRKEKNPLNISIIYPPTLEENYQENKPRISQKLLMSVAREMKKMSGVEVVNLDSISV